MCVYIYIYIYIYIYREREREREREVFKKIDFIIIIFFWFLTSSPAISKLINKSLNLIWLLWQFFYKFCRVFLHGGPVVTHL